MTLLGRTYRKLRGGSVALLLVPAMGTDFALEPGNVPVAMASPHGRQEIEALLAESAQQAAARGRRGR